MCIRVEFHQMKNGLFACLARCHEVERLGRDFLIDGLHPLLVSGPVSVILPPAKLWITPRGPNFFLNSGSFG